jgi:LPPG:FO 2-phospho-L-lactate transferase
MLDVVGDDLAVIANTGDDIDIYGVHVSPDPDLITFWLADLIDERGWGLEGDTFDEMERRKAAGEDIWFHLGDRDLELCRLRTEAGSHSVVADAVGVRARVLPMSADPVRTFVRAGDEWHPFQEFMIRRRGEQPDGFEFRGIEAARPSPEVLAALSDAEVIVIGPSNPVISIGPILALPGIRDALRTSAAPVVAVSPFVAGRAVKGPTEAFCRAAGLPAGPAAVAEAYAGLIDGAVADERIDRVPTLETDVRLDTPAARARVARETLAFAAALGRS